mmetsp:Transcript_67464/g.133760  ORF Transcript_67464/g.133760 Transcript_67464/m.133760 type:complete len:294 (+) Transcript_67464:650-1531(+)
MVPVVLLPLGGDALWVCAQRVLVRGQRARQPFERGECLGIATTPHQRRQHLVRQRVPGSDRLELGVLVAGLHVEGRPAEHIDGERLRNLRPDELSQRLATELTDESANDEAASARVVHPLAIPPSPRSLDNPFDRAFGRGCYIGHCRHERTPEIVGVLRIDKELQAAFMTEHVLHRDFMLAVLPECGPVLSDLVLVLYQPAIHEQHAGNRLQVFPRAEDVLQRVRSVPRLARTVAIKVDHGRTLLINGELRSKLKIFGKVALKRGPHVLPAFGSRARDGATITTAKGSCACSS